MITEELMEDGSGWFADPEVEGQERYFDGSEWTTETRPADSDVPLHHLPDHAGELQRALAAATDDIDDVEDRLGSLFDRAEHVGERMGRARKKVHAEDVHADDDDEVVLGAEEVRGAEDAEDEEPDPGQNVYVGEPGSVERGVALAEADRDVDDDDALADLDEALASEEPEKLPKKFFRRRP